MLKVVIVSDTHLIRQPNDLPDGDILIHCGDATMRGNTSEVARFATWFNNQTQFKERVFVPGNHDFLFQTDYYMAASMLDGHVLVDRRIDIRGLKLYGAPWVPGLPNWAFSNLKPDEAKRKWSQIPDDTHILITHGPPYGIRDLTTRSKEWAGCPYLRDEVLGGRIKPLIHCFGHIHEGAGTEEKNGIKFVNAALLEFDYSLNRSRPYVCEIDPDSGLVMEGPYF